MARDVTVNTADGADAFIEVAEQMADDGVDWWKIEDYLNSARKKAQTK